MKKYFGNFKIVLLFAAMLALMAFTPSVFPVSTSPPGEKPLSFTSMDFPKDIIILKAAENTWMQKGDFVYSIYQDNGAYFASWDVGFKSQNLIIKSFASDPEHPVKTGIGSNETAIWGLWRNDTMRMMEITTYKDKYYTYGKAVIKFRMTVFDNLYFSLDPIWPAATEFKILPPIAGQYIYFRDVFAYRPMMPKYVAGACKLEICEGSALVRNSTTFNMTQIKFTAADIERGYVVVTIRGTPLKNSSVSSTSKNYKLYWN